MRIISALLFFFMCSSASAQLFQCVKDGKTSFQDSPCDAASKVVKITTSGNEGAFSPWDKLSASMTIEQVRQKIPNTKPGDNDRFANGATVQLQVPAVNFNGFDFAAKIAFLDGKFAQVNFARTAAGLK